jgi:hypothetical protein
LAGQATAQWCDEEVLVRIAQTFPDPRSVAAVHQGQEDAPRGTVEFDEEFGEPISQMLQRHVEQWLVIDRQVHRLEEQEFFALEMTDHRCGIRAGRRRDLADGGPGEALALEQPGSG